VTVLKEVSMVTISHMSGRTDICASDVEEPIPQHAGHTLPRGQTETTQIRNLPDFQRTELLQEEEILTLVRPPR
jgi:hypothetical protein